MFSTNNSQVFSNAQSVLSQCNTWLRLLHLLYDIEVMWQKAIKHAFSTCLFKSYSTNETWVFDQSECVRGPIYITNYDKELCTVSVQ